MGCFVAAVRRDCRSEGGKARGSRQAGKEGLEENKKHDERSHYAIENNTARKNEAKKYLKKKQLCENCAEEA